MNLDQGIFLGAVQGLTEFLPISSTAHLILIPRLFGWPAHPLALDAVMHLGTGLAVLVYFRRDWVAMLCSLWSDIRNRGASGGLTAESRRFIGIAIASLPVGAAGFLLGDWVEASLRGGLLVVASLVVVGGLMLVAEVVAQRRVGRSAVSFGDTLWIGTSQVLALIPGVSRSGITVTTGIFRGLTLESAARFSFLVGTPVTLAAGFWEAFKLPPLATGDFLNLACALGASLFAGLLAILLFLKLIRRVGLWPFAAYRFGVALVVLFLLR